jgi:hypothetical protein
VRAQSSGCTVTHRQVGIFRTPCRTGLATGQHACQPVATSAGVAGLHPSEFHRMSRLFLTWCITYLFQIGNKIANISPTDCALQAGRVRHQRPELCSHRRAGRGRIAASGSGGAELPRGSTLTKAFGLLESGLTSTVLGPLILLLQRGAHRATAGKSCQSLPASALAWHCWSCLC